MQESFFTVHCFLSQLILRLRIGGLNALWLFEFPVFSYLVPLIKLLIEAQFL